MASKKLETLNNETTTIFPSQEKLDSIQISENVIEALKSQRSKYKTFERTQARANQQLYAVLSKAFDAYTELKTGTDEQVRNNINTFKLKVEKQKGAYAKASTAATSLQLRIVRFICGDSITDKTATAYAKVIKVASTEKPADVAFDEWVTAAGGINNVRITRTGEAPKDFKQRGIDILSTRNSAFAFDSNSVAKADTDSGNQFSVAVVRNNDDGTQDIVWSTNKSALINAALKTAGKELDKEETAQDAEQTSIDADAELHAAANSTTAELVSNEYELEAA